MHLPRLSFSNYGNTPFEKLIGHNKAILDKWVSLELVLFQCSTLGNDLLEQVRRTTAFENECEYCMVKAGRPNFNKNERRINTAAAFARLFAADHKSITEAHFEMLREEFTEAEISELCSFISFITATQRLGHIYNLKGQYQANAVTTVEELNRHMNHHANN